MTNVRLNLNPAPTGTITVNYTLSGSATRGTDYTISGGSGASRTVSVPGGSTFVNIPVVITNDNAQESNETIVLTLNTGSGYNVGTTNAVHTRTITDDDTPSTPVADFAAATSTVGEASGLTNVRLNLNPAPTGTITVNYTLSGSATRGTDYTISGGSGASRTVSVPSGSTFVHIPVVITNDSTQESNETIILTLNTGTGYNVGTTNAAHTRTITDDETEPAPRRRQPVYQDPPNFCRSAIHDVLKPDLQAFPNLGYEAPPLRPCSGSGLLILTSIDKALDEEQLERQRGIYITTQLQDIPDYRSRFRGSADNELYIIDGEDEQRYNVIRPQNMIDLHLWLIKRRPESNLNTVEQVGRREALSVELLVCIRDRSRGADRATNVAVWDPGNLHWRVPPMSFWLPDDKLCTLTNRVSSFILVREIKPEPMRDDEGILLLEAAGDSDPEPSESSEGRSIQPEELLEAEGEATDDPIDSDFDLDDSESTENP